MVTVSACLLLLSLVILKADPPKVNCSGTLLNIHFECIDTETTECYTIIENGQTTVCRGEFVGYSDWVE